MPERILQPLIVVLFGVTGDLARRKLIPALFDLYCKKILPREFLFISCGRRALSREEYEQLIRDSLSHSGVPEQVESFVKLSIYHEGEFTEQKTYELLRIHINRSANMSSDCPLVLYYIATGPNLYETVLEQMGKSNLLKLCTHKTHKDNARLLVEKPFGKDNESRKTLEKIIDKYALKSQVYRVDHYLSKRALALFRSLRESGGLLETAVTYHSIKHIRISLHEKIGLEKRATFYENVGAFLDVGQNHLLAMLSSLLVSGGVKYPQIGRERSILMKSLMLVPHGKKTKWIRGQYTGYRSEAGVSPYSNVETFFRIHAQINMRDKEVPVTIESGKALKDSHVFFEIEFDQKEGDTQSEVCRVTVQPDVKVDFLIKGEGTTFEKVTFYPKEDFFDAYSALFVSALIGDTIPFSTREEVEAQWKFALEVKKEFERVPLTLYKTGEDPTFIV